MFDDRDTTVKASGTSNRAPETTDLSGNGSDTKLRRPPHPLRAIHPRKSHQDALGSVFTTGIA